MDEIVELNEEIIQLKKENKKLKKKSKNKEAIQKKFGIDVKEVNKDEGNKQ